MVALTDTEGLDRSNPLALGLNLSALALLIWGVTSEAHPGLAGARLAALVLLVAAASGWVAWVRTGTDLSRWWVPTSVAVMGLAGGALAVFAPLAVTFVGVAALAATIGWPGRLAFFLAVSGPAALAVAVPADGHTAGVLVGGVAAALAGAVMGSTRRQARERGAQTALVQISEARAEAERARAELLAGRNHLARELHDILAHTLSALSIQLEGLDALLTADSHPLPAGVRDQLDRTKRLVREGLEEARGAVRALREDAPALEDQLRRLAEDGRVRLEVAGPARPLPPDVSLALYRVAQEALTNVVKHAPGARTVISLGFQPDRVRLRVSNGPGGADVTGLTDSGAGLGLQGIRERMLLIGGQVEAGPAGGGWRVEAEVPA